jgi:hypothetical protein
MPPAPLPVAAVPHCAPVAAAPLGANAAVARALMQFFHGTASFAMPVRNARRLSRAVPSGKVSAGVLR